MSRGYLSAPTEHRPAQPAQLRIDPSRSRPQQIAQPLQRPPAGAGSGHRVKRNFDRNRQVMLVKIGDLVWTVTDVQAYRSMVEAYDRVAKLAEVVLRASRPTR